MNKSIRVYTKIKRPASKGTLIGVRIQPEQLADLDNWRRQQDDLPNRPEAIRRLIATALTILGTEP